MCNSLESNCFYEFVCLDPQGKKKKSVNVVNLNYNIFANENITVTTISAIAPTKLKKDS